LLDGVLDYLPNPTEIENYALGQNEEGKEERVLVNPERSGENHFLGLSFKLEAGKYGQLTYMRTYQGELRKGETVVNTRTGKKVKIPRIIQMHANEMKDITQTSAGDICAFFGVDCSSGDSFVPEKAPMLSMESIHVPEPVISLAIEPKSRTELDRFSKAINRFTREDPTFRVYVDPESKETVIRGMGELHLEIYQQRMKNEYNCDVISGKPKVAFRETLGKSRSPFEFTYKKQSGGSGQYGKVIGYLETFEDESDNMKLEFEDLTSGNNIPRGFIPAIEKGFFEACDRGLISGHKLAGVRFVLEDGQSHEVDSSELAFKMAAMGATKQAMENGSPFIMEPVMAVEVVAPNDMHGPVIGGVSKRKGVITGTETGPEYFTLYTDVPLNSMFGFSTELRTLTAGRGEYSMDFTSYAPAAPDTQAELIQAFKGPGDTAKAAKGGRR